MTRWRRIGMRLRRPSAAVGLVGAFVVQAIFLAMFWEGVGLRDAVQYLTAALDWVSNGPVIGADHWALRVPFVAPIAASLALFGGSEFAAALPNILYTAGLVGVSFVFVHAIFGRASATALAVLIAASPFLSVQASEIRVYGPEIFFTALALWLAIDATRKNRRGAHRLALSGVAAGLAWLCRESAIFLAPALVFAIWRSEQARPARAWMKGAVTTLVGFFAVIAGEIAFYAVQRSAPFYRYRIDLNHGGGDPDSTFAGVEADESVLDFILRPVVDVAQYPLALPVVLIAVAAAPLVFRRDAHPAARSVLVVFSTATGLSIAIASYLLNLDEVEYFPILIYWAALVSALAVGELWRRRHARAAIGALAAIVSIQALLADFVNFDELAEARYANAISESADASVVVDHITFDRALMLARLRSLDLGAATPGLGVYDASISCAELDRPMIFLRGSPVEGRYLALPPATPARLVAHERIKKESRLRRWVFGNGVPGFFPDAMASRLALSPPMEVYQLCAEP